MKVVLPRPDSPATMTVKAAPRFATILWRWLGSYMDCISVLSDPSIVAVGETHVGNANWRHCFGHFYEWDAVVGFAGIPGRYRSFGELECYAAQTVLGKGDVGDVLTDKR